MNGSTPGPWEYDAESMQVIAPKCGYQWTVPPVIATVESLDYCESGPNGLVIAASLDLLQSCKEVVRALEALTTKQQRGFYDISLRNALEAIARATGDTR